VERHGKPDELVTLQELAVSNAYEISALSAVLERNGILTQCEILEERQRQRQKKVLRRPDRRRPDAICRALKTA